MLVAFLFHTSKYSGLCVEEGRVRCCAGRFTVWFARCWISEFITIVCRALGFLTWGNPIPAEPWGVTACVKSDFGRG